MLETIWFVLWTLLWAVYFVLDGFDLGLGTLLPFLGKTEEERRIMYNAAGPFWDGNEVWLISAGGVTFAAFPKAYAVMFSALYAPLLILLFALIFRAVSFEFRNKVESAAWRSLWDGVHFLANLIPSLLLGVAFANLFMGIPVDAQGVYHGSLLGLLNIYGLAGGVFFVCMFVLHGAIINTNTVLGAACLVNSGALVDHDNVLEDGVHVNLHATIKAWCHMEPCARTEAATVLYSTRRHIDGVEDHNLEDALFAFKLGETASYVKPFGAGHINDTYAVYMAAQGGDELRYVIQRINTGVFKDPRAVLENIFFQQLIFFLSQRWNFRLELWVNPQ